MEFDASTLFAVNVAVTLANAALLLWSWLQNREERSLRWAALAYFCVAIGNILLAGRDYLPLWLAIDVANALITYGIATIWTIARVFNGKPAPQWVVIAGVAVWLIAGRIPIVAESADWRVVVASSIAAFYCLIAAREFWIRDGLRTRIPLTLLVGFHGLVVLGRIPIVVSEAGTSGIDFSSAWFAPMALETMVFVQALAVLVLALNKERAEVRLRVAALTDPLSDLPNRRAFFEQGARLIALQRRSGRPTSLVAFDLDRFKQVNDTYGHPFGDAVIEAFAIAIKTGLRSGDLAGRIGGEEFAAVLPGADEATARVAAERVMAIFMDTVGVEETDSGRFTASAGLAVSRASEQTLDALFLAADRALYEAKDEGGNRLRISGPVFPGGAGAFAVGAG